MLLKRRLGDIYEQKAKLLLEQEKYKIVARNYTSRYGEIDLIATSKSTEKIVFIEVRYRQPGSLVSAIESVDKYKKEKLWQLANNS